MMSFDGTAAEIKAGLRSQATARSLTLEQAAQARLDDYYAAHEDAEIRGEDGSVDSVDLSAADSGGGGGKVKLPKSRRWSDFIYHKSSSLGVEHGHAGIYVRRDLFVEAANGSLGVRQIRPWNRNVPKGTYVLYREAVWKQRRSNIANSAKSQVGKDYRSWYKYNRYMSAPWNCSQLVWAAFRKHGVQLDPDGGYVWPIDLATAPRVYYYRKL